MIFDFWRAPESEVGKMTSKVILVVDDDPEIREGIRILLGV